MLMRCNRWCCREATPKESHVGSGTATATATAAAAATLQLTATPTLAARSSQSTQHRLRLQLQLQLGALHRARQLRELCTGRQGELRMCVERREREMGKEVEKGVDRQRDLLSVH